jgi:hypothetical protein
VLAGGGLSPTRATYFDTAAVLPAAMMPDLGTVVTGPFADGSALAAGAYMKTIPGALLYEEITGPVGGDFILDLFDLQADLLS